MESEDAGAAPSRRAEELAALVARGMRAATLTYDVARAPVGPTSTTELWRDGPARLLRYGAHPRAWRGPAVLLVPSIVTRPYILDLHEGGSFVQYLLGCGFDVYLLDWGEPRPCDAGLRLEDYVQRLLPRAVRQVARRSSTGRVMLLGYCLGGVLTLLYASLYRRAPVSGLVCLATPVDFQQLGLFSRWTDRRWFDVDGLVARVGNVPAEMIRAAFTMLRPATAWSAARLFGMWRRMDDGEFVRGHQAFGRWADDHVPFAGACFRQIVTELMWENRLLAGTLRLGGRAARLEAIRWPVLSVTAARDHIVPPAASAPLIERLGSANKRAVELPGGHVGMVAGPAAVRQMWPLVASWMDANAAAILPDRVVEQPRAGGVQVGGAAAAAEVRKGKSPAERIRG